VSPVGQTSRLTSVVEHLRNALVQRGHDHIAEQSIETCQQQSTQHHGDEDLDGGVDVTLARARRMALARMELTVFLINFFM